MINRRSLFKFLAAGAGAALLPATRSEAALPKAKITRVKCWAHPSMNRSFSQSGMLVTVETDIGITGIGEGGSPDLIQDLAGSLIGKSPFEIGRSGTTCIWTGFTRRDVKRSMGKARSIWRYGTSKERRCSSRCTTYSTEPRAPMWSVMRRRSGQPARRRRDEEQVRLLLRRSLAQAVAVVEGAIQARRCASGHEPRWRQDIGASG